MALILTNATSSPSATTRTLVYTAPTGVTATIFDGTISNKDDTNKLMHYVTVELEDSGVFTSLGKNVAIPYGVSPQFPKLVVKPGQKLHITIDTADTIDFVVSIAERN